MLTLSHLLPNLVGHWREASPEPSPTTLIPGDPHRGLSQRIWTEHSSEVRQSCRLVFFAKRPLLAAWGRLPANGRSLCCDWNTLFVDGRALPARRGVPLLFRFHHSSLGEGFGAVSSLGGFGQMHVTTYTALEGGATWLDLVPIQRWGDHLLKPIIRSAMAESARG